jgi:hypothetical protein
VLEQHSDLAYLNEPRHIWSLDPKTDIWSDRAASRGGRLRLTDEDVNPQAASRIRCSFAAEVLLNGGQRLVEKLPINSFRAEYVNAMFPDAKFVHLVRNGMDVAGSIANVARRGGWFGHNDYKWHLLLELARARGAGEIGDLCSNDFLRGLWEWRLSVQTAQASLAQLPASRTFELRYEHLVDEPLDSCRLLETFLELPPDPAVRSFAVSSIEPRTPFTPRHIWNDAAEYIVGELMVSLRYAPGASTSE